jgi:hypothetical protein
LSLPVRRELRGCNCHARDQLSVVSLSPGPFEPVLDGAAARGGIPGCNLTVGWSGNFIGGFI